jgi:hypothetical protein
MGVWPRRAQRPNPAGLRHQFDGGLSSQSLTQWQSKRQIGLWTLGYLSQESAPHRGHATHIGDSIKQRMCNVPGNLLLRDIPPLIMALRSCSKFTRSPSHYEW